jgi:hypothetical protein
MFIYVYTAQCGGVVIFEYVHHIIMLYWCKVYACLLCLKFKDLRKHQHFQFEHFISGNETLADLKFLIIFFILSNF